MRVIWNVIETLTPPFDEKAIFDTLNRFSDEQCSWLKIKHLNRNGGETTKTADIDKPILVEDQMLTFFVSGKKKAVRLENLLEIKGKILKNETPE